MRLIQHKREAYWFYRFLSLGYDRWVNPLFWTPAMRELALEKADLAPGQTVLDTGAGTGFTTEGIVARVDAASVTMLDQSPHQLARSRTKPALANCPRVLGDAENLPFDDESFDALINVEAGAHYPHFPRFLAEVVRVLRPGGHFLYADLRNREVISAWEAALADSRMRLNCERVVNTEVLRGMEKNSQRSRDLVSRILPALLRRIGHEFAGVQGSQVYRDLQRGKISYRMYCFAKD